MFSGIVSSGRVVGSGPVGARLTVAQPALEAAVELGESVAVNGVCLTVAEHHHDEISVDLMPESLRRSNLGRLTGGALVNIERSLRLGDRIGGHFIQGHVDGVAEVVSIRPEAEARVVYFRLADASLSRYVVEKGFVSVDGVSLTVVDALTDGFSVSLVQTTLARSTLGHARPGYVANVEIDLFARYLIDRPRGRSLSDALSAPAACTVSKMARQLPRCRRALAARRPAPQALPVSPEQRQIWSEGACPSFRIWQRTDRAGPAATTIRR